LKVLKLDVIKTVMMDICQKKCFARFATCLKIFPPFEDFSFKIWRKYYNAPTKFTFHFSGVRYCFKQLKISDLVFG